MKLKIARIGTLIRNAHMRHGVCIKACADQSGLFGQVVTSLNDTPFGSRGD